MTAAMVWCCFSEVRSLRHCFLACRGLCSFSHPELKEDNGQMLVFRSINQLKRQLVDTRHLQLCNICVENRKVTCALAPSSRLHSPSI